MHLVVGHSPRNLWQQYAVCLKILATTKISKIGNHLVVGLKICGSNMLYVLKYLQSQNLANFQKVAEIRKNMWSRLLNGLRL